MGLLLFFGFGLLGVATLYWTIRYARTPGQHILFGLVGTALLAAQCALVKFFAYFGQAFGGDDASSFVLGSIVFSAIAVLIFLVSAANKFSNGKE